MPIMDGHEATKAIRVIDKMTPIVGLTGNALDEQRVEFLAAGADAVLTKPLNRSRSGTTQEYTLLGYEI